MDLAKQQVVVGKIRSNKLETWAALEADGQLDWQKLFASQPSKPAAKAAAEPASTPAAADSPKAEPPAPSKPWQVLLKDVQLRNYTVHLADRSAKPAVALDITPLNVDLQDFDSLNGSPFKLKLDSGVGKQGKITADGTVNLAPVNAQLNVKTQDIDLRVAQSYINPFIRLELRSGMLGSDLKVNLKSTEPLALSVTGRAQIDQLHTLDTLKTRDFLKWQQVVVEGLNYQHGDSLSIDKVNLFQPYARFMINDDRTTNIDDLLIPQPADSGAKSTAAKPASNDKPLGIHIGGIAINDGSANFADFSLTPNFATADAAAQRPDRHHRQPPGETGQRRHQRQGRPLCTGDHQGRGQSVRPDGQPRHRHQFQTGRADHADALLRQVRRLPHPQGPAQPRPALPDHQGPAQGREQSGGRTTATG